MQHRTDGKYFLLSALSTALVQKKIITSEIRALFSNILRYNEIFKTRRGVEIAEKLSFYLSNIIGQSEIYANIFFPLLNSSNNMNSQQLYSHLCYCEFLIFTYISAIHLCNIETHQCISECIIDILIRLGKIDELNEILGSNFIAFNRNLALYLVKLCKNYPILITNVIDICIGIDCLDGLFELVSQTGSPNDVKQFIKSLNSLNIINSKGEPIKIIDDLKLTAEYPSHFLKKEMNSVEIEIITTFLKDLTIENITK
ncbi:hypothetical protein MXB_691 [Myxobolus squamalis]|nr:hypothetical protein MXB_691 [Myxobolus squamalis]